MYSFICVDFKSLSLGEKKLQCCEDILQLCHSEKLNWNILLNKNHFYNSVTLYNKYLDAKVQIKKKSNIICIMKYIQNF